MQTTNVDRPTSLSLEHTRVLAEHLDRANRAHVPLKRFSAKTVAAAVAACPPASAVMNDGMSTCAGQAMTHGAGAGPPHWRQRSASSSASVSERGGAELEARSGAVAAPSDSQCSESGPGLHRSRCGPLLPGIYRLRRARDGRTGSRRLHRAARSDGARDERVRARRDGRQVPP